MLPRFLGDRKFYSLLFSFDEDLAKEARLASCPHCQAPIHQANFTRKPRGGPDSLDDEFTCRFSFCCSVCRKRLTPASLRFLGRKVYFGSVMVLISAMLGDASPRRRRRLSEICGADARTLGRWRKWWAETFSQTNLWKYLSASFALAWASNTSLPRQLLKGLKISSLQEALREVLRLLRPLFGWVRASTSTLFYGR